MESSIKFRDEKQLKDEGLRIVSGIDGDGDDGREFDVALLRVLKNVKEKSLFDFHQKKYNIVSEAEVRKCQEDDINNMSDILSISKAEASILLLHFNWNVHVVPDAWFTDGQKLREELGLLEYPMVRVESSDAKTVTCEICLKTFSPELTSAAMCGHTFCMTCWEGVIKASVIDGPACLMLRCPQPSCRAAVGQDMIYMLASDDDKKTYERYFLRSYVESTFKGKWCPAPGCNFSAILVGDSYNSKITCKCSYSFCWKCNKEYHQPINCAALRSWEMGSLVHFENWIIANTEDCPKCGQSVEVNGHFKRLECASCKFHFCKLCLSSWLKHGFWKGDQYTHVCSEGKLKQPVIGEDDQNLIDQDNMIRFYDTQSLWKTHDMHIQAALKEIHEFQSGLLKTLADKQDQTEADVSFVREAWLQIIDCKRFLKWARVYEYYLPKCETERRSLINFLLRVAEVVLEQLYQTASDLSTFLNMDKPSADFINFRILLFFKTSMARNYFDSMVWAVENSLSNLNALRHTMRSRKPGLSTIAPGKDEQKGKPNHKGPWNCAQCQFPNDSLALSCVMCGYH